MKTKELINEKYPRRTGLLLCQCGGEFITEKTTQGSLWNERDSYRVHCKWCQSSSRWLTSEYDCIIELTKGMGIRLEQKKCKRKL